MNSFVFFKKVLRPFNFKIFLKPLEWLTFKGEKEKLIFVTSEGLNPGPFA